MSLKESRILEADKQTPATLPLRGPDGNDLYGGKITTDAKATHFFPTTINPGTEKEQVILVPITINPEDAVPMRPSTPTSSSPGEGVKSEQKEKV